ncbi:MAG TPA: hypothetical protein VE439_08230 [Anaerolineae bacterium]|nr:hypothetical protein [Anaerolineae bacterium]
MTDKVEERIERWVKFWFKFYFALAIGLGIISLFLPHLFTGSTYWAVRYLFWGSSAMVAAIGCFHLGIDILRLKAKRESKPVSAGNQSETALKATVAKTLLSIPVFAFGLFLLTSGYNGAIPTMRDVPLIVQGRYAVVEGVLTDYKLSLRSSGWMRLYIRDKSGVETEFYYRKRLRYLYLTKYKGQKVRITYLPYTHRPIKHEVLASKCDQVN